MSGLSFYLDLILKARIRTHICMYVIIQHGNCSFKIIMRQNYYSLLNYVAHVQRDLQNMFSKILGTFSVTDRTLVACNIPQCSLLNFGSSFKPCFYSHLFSGFPSQPSHRRVPNFLFYLSLNVHIVSVSPKVPFNSPFILTHLISITQLHHNTHSMKDNVQS